MALMLMGSFLLVACRSTTSISVQTDSTIEAKIERLSTYAWVPDASTRQGKERINNIPELDKLLKSAVEAQLNARGYEKVGFDKADMRLVYHVALLDKSVDEQVGMYHSRTTEWSYDNALAHNVHLEFEKGSFLLDVLNPENDGVMWRGLVSTVVEPDKSLTKRRQKVYASLAKMMKTFPFKK